VSISPTFYQQLFHSKAAGKMLMKFPAGVNVINILRAAFPKYSLAKKLPIQTVSTENLFKTLLYKKTYNKCVKHFKSSLFPTLFPQKITN